MRVITGLAKGRRLAELPGLDTRPTTSKMKEGLFSAIQFDVEGRRVLDLFAGTGQLGIEALSRGASFCDFVDSAPAALKVVQRNVKICGFEDRATFHGKDFNAFLTGRRERYGLIFLDPPYAAGLLEGALEMISRFDILANHGIMVCESPAERELPDLPAPCSKHRVYHYGKTRITTYHREEDVER